jgi:hypothetical protein
MPKRKTIRLFFDWLDRFDDSTMNQVLLSTLQTCDAFLIIERYEGTIGSLSTALLEFFLLLLAPFIWPEIPWNDPFRRRLEISRFHLFDRLVSCLRSRSPQDLTRLIDALPEDASGASIWHLRRHRARHTWAMGYMSSLFGWKTLRHRTPQAGRVTGIYDPLLRVRPGERLSTREDDPEDYDTEHERQGREQRRREHLELFETEGHGGWRGWLGMISLVPGALWEMGVIGILARLNFVTPYVIALFCAWRPGEIQRDNEERERRWRHRERQARAEQAREPAAAIYSTASHATEPPAAGEQATERQGGQVKERQAERDSVNE